MKHNHIVFWQLNPSPHQAPWIRALAELSPVTAIFSGDLLRHRLDLGWQKPDYGKVQVLIYPDRPTLKDLLWRDPERTVHVFSGGHYARLNSAVREALSTGSLVGILSEGRDWRRLPGLLRQAHSLLNERSYQKRVRFVLAVGHLAARWFRMCGYSQEQVFPFCYAVDSPVVTSRDCSNMPRVNLCFIGQLIKRKRVDLLLCSLSRINSRNWFLRIIGSGKERLRLEKLVNSLGLAGMVDFTGVLDNPSARTQLAQSDVVVLPSQWDGWGAVVNEALMSGVPVICNDFCGASDLIQPIFNGELFECGSVDSLAVVLDKWISRGPLDVLARQKIRSWSRCIEGEAVARYFIQVVDYLTGSALERPKASWLSEDAVSLYY